MLTYVMLDHLQEEELASHDDSLPHFDVRTALKF